MYSVISNNYHYIGQRNKILLSAYISYSENEFLIEKNLYLFLTKFLYIFFFFFQRTVDHLRGSTAFIGHGFAAVIIYNVSFSCARIRDSVLTRQRLLYVSRVFMTRTPPRITGARYPRLTKINFGTATLRYDTTAV